MKNEYWSIPKGRISRRTYTKRIIILVVLNIFLMALSEFFSYSEIIALLMYLPAIYIALLMCMQIIKRLHDINASGWWCILALIPYVGVLFIIYLMFKKGTPGPNRFGPPPPDTDTAPPQVKNRHFQKRKRVKIKKTDKK